MFYTPFRGVFIYERLSIMSDAIKAYSGENNSVIYEYADGKIEEWIGGDRNWRNQNPGNVVSTKINWEGKIGTAGRFCVFSNPEFGKRVTRKILDNRRKEGKTLEQAIHSYAPSIENNTDAYIKFLENYSGVKRSTFLYLVDEILMEKIAQGIFIHEGRKIGVIKVIRQAKNTRVGKYIWRTAKDEKVRSLHAKRDGKIFDFSYPPDGGNPGEDYNCRCWAETIPTQDDIKAVFKK